MAAFAASHKVLGSRRLTMALGICGWVVDRRCAGATRAKPAVAAVNNRLTRCSS